MQQALGVSGVDLASFDPFSPSTPYTSTLLALVPAMHKVGALAKQLSAAVVALYLSDPLGLPPSGSSCPLTAIQLTSVTRACYYTEVGPKVYSSLARQLVARGGLATLSTFIAAVVPAALADVTGNATAIS